jgi:hypothetical protein
MFRTRATALTQNFEPRTAAMPVSHARPTDLRLRWTARDGRLMARWEREPHDPTEGRAWSVSRIAA